MNDWLVFFGFVAAVALYGGLGTYWENTVSPRREARRTGRSVTVHLHNGMKTFRPDGSHFFNRFY